MSFSSYINASIFAPPIPKPIKNQEIKNGDLKISSTNEGLNYISSYQSINFNKKKLKNNNVTIKNNKTNNLDNIYDTLPFAYNNDNNNNKNNDDNINETYIIIHFHGNMENITLSHERLLLFTTSFIFNISKKYQENNDDINDDNNNVEYIKKTIFVLSLSIEFPGYIKNDDDDINDVSNFSNDIIKKWTYKSMNLIKSFRDNLKDSNPKTILWGYSIGTGFLMRLIDTINKNNNIDIIDYILLQAPFSSLYSLIMNVLNRFNNNNNNNMPIDNNNIIENNNDLYNNDKNKKSSFNSFLASSSSSLKSSSAALMSSSSSNIFSFAKSYIYSGLINIFWNNDINEYFPNIEILKSLKLKQDKGLNVLKLGLIKNEDAPIFFKNEDKKNYPKIFAFCGRSDLECGYSYIDYLNLENESIIEKVIILNCNHSNFTTPESISYLSSKINEEIFNEKKLDLCC